MAGLEALQIFAVIGFHSDKSTLIQKGYHLVHPLVVQDGKVKVSDPAPHQLLHQGHKQQSVCQPVIVTVDIPESSRSAACSLERIRIEKNANRLKRRSVI